MRPNQHKPSQSTARGAETTQNNLNRKEAPSKGGAYHISDAGRKVNARSIRKPRRPDRQALNSSGGEPILLKRDQVCRLLGDISGRSVARLEERGLLRSTGLLRHKLYRRADVEALANELNWEA